MTNIMSFTVRFEFGSFSKLPQLHYHREVVMTAATL